MMLLSKESLFCLENSMKYDSTQMIEQQKAVCSRYRVKYVPSDAPEKSGFALSTKGMLPINGLRHAPGSGTSGWFIWCGEAFSEADDFFAPLHTFHIYEENPEIGRLLGLPPGYRFLLAGDYLDVWYDEALLRA
jgi:hypothetical protein